MTSRGGGSTGSGGDEEVEALACPRVYSDPVSPGAVLTYTDGRFAVIYFGSLKHENGVFKVFCLLLQKGGLKGFKSNRSVLHYWSKGTGVGQRAWQGHPGAPDLWQRWAWVLSLTVWKRGFPVLLQVGRSDLRATHSLTHT